MLPRKIRNRMFERMSNKTMRAHFTAQRKRDASAERINVHTARTC
jgi:hypothetical protein